MYGVDPIKAGLAGDPGSYNVFNGALTEFTDAYNVELYSLFNNGALDTNTADYTGRRPTSPTIAEGTATKAADYFYDFGTGDLSGFLQTPLTFLEIPL